MVLIADHADTAAGNRLLEERADLRQHPRQEVHKHEGGLMDGQEGRILKRPVHEKSSLEELLAHLEYHCKGQCGDTDIHGGATVDDRRDRHNGDGGEADFAPQEAERIVDSRNLQLGILLWAHWFRNAIPICFLMRHRSRCHCVSHLDPRVPLLHQVHAAKLGVAQSISGLG